MEVLGADANQQEALFLINYATYLPIQSCDSGCDYTLYDAASMKELDGGQLDMPELSRKMQFSRFVMTTIWTALRSETLLCP